LYKTPTSVTAYTLQLTLSLNESQVRFHPTSDSSGLSEWIKLVTAAGQRYAQIPLVQGGNAVVMCKS